MIPSSGTRRRSSRRCVQNPASDCVSGVIFTRVEQKEEYSLSAESISAPKQSTASDQKSAWADVPMRAFAGGFYHHLIRLYDYLGIEYHSQQFVYSFSRLSATPTGGSVKASQIPPYMVHASGFHRIPPMPRDADVFAWLLAAVYAIFFNLWFTLCAYYVAPYEDSSSTSSSETLDHYLRRIHLPQHYASNYLLPMMASVCTCSHRELLDFPASDVLGYKRQTHGQAHYVVDSGVRHVQDELARGLDAELGVCLTRVAPGPDGVVLQYVDATGTERLDKFDIVVLAISPDVIATVFEPLRESLRRIPTTTVETVAHSDRTTLPQLADEGSPSRPAGQKIHFRSSKESTEAIHEQSDSSIIVTTNPLTPIKPSHILRSAHFTRVLRSSESRQIVNSIFESRRRKESSLPETGKSSSPWRNGDGGVYLAGGWCWDGMVLLEGCVVSAMRVASDLDVEIPWDPSFFSS
jgi:hypothetical protein